MSCPMKSPSLFLVLCSLFLASATGAASGPVAIESYVEQVRKANPNLQALRLRSEAQKERVGPAGAWDDPFFAVGPDEVPFEGGEGSVLRFQLSQAIPFPGKSGTRKKIARLRAAGSEADASTLERSLVVSAHQAFYRLYFNRNALRLNAQTRGLIEAAVESTKARYRTGDSTHHDWLLAKVELSVLEVQRLRLEREGRTLQALFNELRDLPGSTEVVLADPDFSKIESQTDQGSPGESSQAITEQPEIRSLGQAIQAFEAEETLAKLGYAPDFVVQGMVMMSGHGAEMSNWGLMVGINLPIYFLSKQSNQVSAARLEREAATAELRGLENRLRVELNDARQQLATSRDVVRLYRKEVMPSTDIAARNAQTAYAARKLPLSQLLDALRVQRVQSLELTAAQIDLALASVRVRELLSSPPMIRLAPARPSLFGASGMGGTGGMSEGSSGSIRMGEGMSGSTQDRTQQRGQQQDSEETSGMGGGM